MSLTKSRDASFYETYIEELMIIEIGSDRFAFRDVDAANAAFKALLEAMPLSYVYSEMENVSYKLPDRSPAINLTRTKVLTEPDIKSLSLNGRIYRFRCDHNIIEHEGVCGISKCYEDAIMTREMYLDKDHPEGWFIFNPEDGYKHWSEYDLENEEPTLHVCCPKCAERIASDLDCEVDALSRSEIWGARQFELDFIEKEKNK
jgi:hypothetical protein